MGYFIQVGAAIFDGFYEGFHLAVISLGTYGREDSGRCRKDFHVFDVAGTANPSDNFFHPIYLATVFHHYFSGFYCEEKAFLLHICNHN